MCGEWPPPARTCTSAASGAWRACAAGMIWSSSPQITSTGTSRSAEAIADEHVLAPVAEDVPGDRAQGAVDAVEALVLQDVVDELAGHLPGSANSSSSTGLSSRRCRAATKPSM